MKRIFIVHGWGGRPDKGWMNWLNTKLTEKGFEVHAERMPNPNFPKIKPWIEYLSSIVKKPDKDTYFIGHSIGCQTIIRYLETLNEKDKIGGVVFVAGWFNLKNLETDEEKKVSLPWLEAPINFEKVKSMINKSVVVLSSDDKWVPVSDGEIFREKLGSKVIIEDKMGHYIEKETKEIPVVLKEILNLLDE